MNYLGQIQKGVDFIEENLGEELLLGSIAKAAGMSSWYFQRMFSAITGDTLKYYIRSRRLAKATRDLVETDKRILDIAFDCQFESQEAFTRAFKKAFDTTPAKYRSLKENLSTIAKVRMDLAYLEHLKKGISMKPQFIEKEEMTLLGLSTTFYSVESDKYNAPEKLMPLWQEFNKRFKEVENIKGNVCYGVVDCSTEEEMKEGILTYYCAIEVESLTNIPEGFQTIIIPKSRYASFEHKGPVAKVDSTINYIYGTWLPKSKEKRTNAPELEVYSADYNPMGEESVMNYLVPLC